MDIYILKCGWGHIYQRVNADIYILKLVQREIGHSLSSDLMWEWARTPVLALLTRYLCLSPGVYRCVRLTGVTGVPCVKVVTAVPASRELQRVSPIAGLYAWTNLRIEPFIYIQVSFRELVSLHVVLHTQEALVAVRWEVRLSGWLPYVLLIIHGRYSAHTHLLCKSTSVSVKGDVVSVACACSTCVWFYTWASFTLVFVFWRYAGVPG